MFLGRLLQLFKILLCHTQKMRYRLTVAYELYKVTWQILPFLGTGLHR